MYRNKAVKLLLLTKNNGFMLSLVVILFLTNFQKAHCQASTSKKIKVVLDAGHGGKDTGCSSGDAIEKKITLSIVKKVGAILENYDELDVIYTREKDEFIELHERAKIANTAKADIFVSVHCNAMPNPDKNNTIYGTETYTMGVHKLNSNLDVAKRENASILLEDDYFKNYEGYDPNSPMTHIIFSQYQRGFLARSLELANRIEKKFELCGRKSKGVKQAGFLVLHQAAMPSVLIETGFLTNSKEADLLSSKDGQNQTAKNIAESILAFYKIDTNLKDEKDDDIEIVSGKKSEEKIKPKDVVKEINDKSQTFRVQLGVFSKPPNDNDKLWKNIKNYEVIQTNGLYKCFINDLKTLEEAKSILAKVKNIGFKDAFIKYPEK